ncbi:hypothetical protein BDR04DRAFT_1128883 [Suillus decipiens]|nr:hypothetical protein BDR04DRAFT_1128883 [Suillus decipiens]
MSDSAISDSDRSMTSLSSLSSLSSASSWVSLMSGNSFATTFSIASSSPHRLSSEEPLAMDQRFFGQFVDAVCALHDEVERSRVLNHRIKLSQALQLHLLSEWALHAPEKFHRKLRVSPDVFDALVNRIKEHPIFYNNSNNPQLPIPIQLAIFLNAIGHYGNAATREDLADWAGVSIGTIYNCWKRHHDDAIHYDPLDREDQNERKRAKQWVEERTCREWRNGFLCVDGTPFNLYQKPGWHGEGFFDKNSNYSLSAQVIIFPHNLRIIDYVIGVPGSLHDSNAFRRTKVARSPNDFFGAGEWLWADSAYATQMWCITPFKRPPVLSTSFITGNLNSAGGPGDLKTIQMIQTAEKEINPTLEQRGKDFITT